MRIDPRHLQILLDVARTGSFSAAATLRNVSQPAISIAVAQLERQLGASLLERSRRGVTLTPAGEILARRAEAIEQQIAAAEQELRLSRAGVAGPLAIGGTPGALASLVPRAVQRMSLSGEPHSLRIIEVGDPDLDDLLRSAKIDLAITSVGVEAPPPDLEELPIQVDVFEIVVAPDNPLPGPSVALADLVEAPWVLPSAAGVYRRQVDAMFFAAQVELPRNVVRCDSLATTKEIVRRTRHITVWPRAVVAGELAAGSLRSLPIRDGAFSRTIGIRRLAKANPSPIAAAFVKALRGADVV